MKQKGKLKRRCKHCKFVMIEERLHVWCDEHPRHKQMQAIPKPKTLMKHTCASHGRIRPW
ncbi:39S ribosomal protein L36, mitochondrial [Frankliniella fusca]|uniref:Ribosomal protein n=1 Tax=Frankliniella fusca TaxID=407009 RepID=A0AAE1HYU6_9NEOP|nr:39S ribosomal protein L36, mitochondrial [Frankliniella fusca]